MTVVRHKQSAGLMMFRRTAAGTEVLLAHPGGPYWVDRHDGAWSIPKGGLDRGETPLEAAIREFREETGFDSTDPYLTLGSVVQRSGKIVHAWAFEGDCDPASACSNVTFTEWPPRSGRMIEIPEIDRVSFFSLDAARIVINRGQILLLDRLADQLKS